MAARLSLHRVGGFPKRGISVLLLAAALAVAQSARADSHLSVLSYNLHGLSPIIAKDDPRARIAAIGALANTYDVALFQEDFEYHGVIRRQMTGRVGVCGNGSTFDVRRLAAKILFAPVTLFLPRFSAPYGAGLSTFVKPALAQQDDVGREPYGVCDGWLGAHFDCWASKGYLRVGIRSPEGVIIDVYSTHLDAGRGKRSVKTRRRQLRMLANAIEKQSEGRAIIVGGDFNIASDRPGDGEVMVEFRERLGLRDSGAGPQLAAWRNRDYILYRSGVQAELSVEQAGEALEFVRAGRALSDHPAVYAHFRVQALAGAADRELEECRAFERMPRTAATLLP